jgi:chromosome segregation ATPase
MFGNVLGAISGDKKIEATVTINTGGLLSAAQTAASTASAHSSAHTSSSTTTTTSTTFENRITGQMEFLKTETEKFKKENENLKAQITKHLSIINNQAKQISELKNEKTVMLKTQASTTITTTTSSDDKAKIAELQRKIEEVCSDDVADKTKINNQELEIGHLKVKVETLESKLTATTMAYEARVNTLTAENKRLNERVSMSQTNDVDDATKIKNLHAEVDKLNAELGARDTLLKQIEENVNHWKLEFEGKCQQFVMMEKEKDSINLSLDMTKHNVEEKDAELTSLNAKFKEIEDKEVILEATITQKEKKILELDAKVTSFNEKVKTANSNSEKFLEKARKAEIDLANATFKIVGLEKATTENKKLADLFQAKAEGFESKITTYEKKIIELTDLVKKREQEISELKSQDLNEDRELKMAKERALQAEKDLEKMKTEDVDDKTIAKVQKERILALEHQIKQVHEINEKQKVTITTHEAEIASLKDKIVLLKKLVADLKVEIENVHGLSMKFEIKKEVTSSSVQVEKMKETVMQSSEYKSLQIQVEQHEHELATEKNAKALALANCEAMAKDLAEVKTELESLKKQYQAAVSQLEHEKSMSLKYFEEKKSFSSSSSKEVETSKQCFQSAVETVSTYKEDIHRSFVNINSQLANLEKELI